MSSLPLFPASVVGSMPRTDAVLDLVMGRHEGSEEEAERRMEEVRLELNQLGRGVRRINQAFFAFNGVYATSAASSSPIGPLLQTLRDGAPSLVDFLSVVREVTSLSQLEAIAGAR